MKKQWCVLLLISFLLMNFLFLSDANAALKPQINLKLKNRVLAGIDYNLEYQGLEYSQLKYFQDVRGIYINLWTLSHKRKREQIIKIINESDLNAIVVDVKDIKGRTPFVSSPLKETVYNLTKKDFKKLVSVWQKKGVYVIGRLAVFKDYTLATKNEKVALTYLTNIKDKLQIVRSKKWTNPYSQDVWNYNINIAEEMAEIGLDEIQFDYIRFPTLRKNSELIIKDNKDYSKSDAIIGFLKKARKNLEGYDVTLSADLFGLTTTAKGDLGIGQDIKRIANQVDYISPMLYPSHYGRGMYGIKNPAREPYQIIANSLADAKEKLGADVIKVRPWLQDFSLTHTYSKKEIKAQIKAVTDEKLTSWLLWNPSSVYTIEALISNDKEGDV
ncbi:MAG: putative glycoside hydrolase [Bacillota bacterium]